MTCKNVVRSACDIVFRGDSRDSRPGVDVTSAVPRIKFRYGVVIGGLCDIAGSDYNLVRTIVDNR